MTRGDEHPPGELGHRSAAIIGGHGRELGVVTEEQFTVSAGAVGLSVSPRRLRIETVPAAGGGRAAVGLDVGPVDGERSRRELPLLFDARFLEGGTRLTSQKLIALRKRDRQSLCHGLMSCVRRVCDLHLEAVRAGLVARLWSAAQ